MRVSFLRWWKSMSLIIVLAAPGISPPASQLWRESTDSWKSRARASVRVVDAGTRLTSWNRQLFDESSTVYLVTQVGISELRNSNRLINRFFSLRLRSLQIVLNRYTPSSSLRRHQIARLSPGRQLEDSGRLCDRPQDREHGHANRRLITRLSRLQFGRWPEQPVAQRREKKKSFSFFKK